jgi:hypothetical protein
LGIVHKIPEKLKRQPVDNSVDNPVDILWIKLSKKVIHFLSTGYPQGYPQEKHTLTF